MENNKHVYNIDVDYFTINEFYLEDLVKHNHAITIETHDHKVTKWKLAEDTNKSYSKTIFIPLDDNGENLKPMSLFEFNKMDKLKVTVTYIKQITIDETLGMIHNSNDDILNKKFEEYEKGQYLIIYWNSHLNQVSYDMMTIHQNLTVVASVFGFDVPHYKILSYRKLL